MLNKIDLMGRLVKDPELRVTNSQIPVTTFTLAVERDFQSGGSERQTDFINCVIWKQGANFVADHFSKGQMLALSGRLQSRKWEGNDGKKHTEWEVVADNVYFCGEKAKEKQTFEELPDSDEDLPF